MIKDISDDSKDFIEKVKEFPFVIGKSECVVTSKEDEVLFSKRKGRNGNTRFVLNREPEDCNSIFTTFKKAKKNPTQLIQFFLARSLEESHGIKMQL